MNEIADAILDGEIANELEIDDAGLLGLEISTDFGMDMINVLGRLAQTCVCDLKKGDKVSLSCKKGGAGVYYLISFELSQKE